MYDVRSAIHAWDGLHATARGPCLLRDAVCVSGAVHGALPKPPHAVDARMGDLPLPRRLVALGYAPEDARRLIGNVVAQEIFAVMQREEAYNEQRYIQALHRLPESVI